MQLATCFYCLSKLNRRNTKGMKGGVSVEMSLSCMHVCEIYKKCESL